MDEVLLTSLKIKCTINLLGEQGHSRKEDIITELNGTEYSKVPLLPAISSGSVEASPHVNAGPIKETEIVLAENGNVAEDEYVRRNR